MPVHVRLLPALRDGIRAAAEVLFPENGFGAPDFRQAAIVDRTLEYLTELPPDKGRLLAGLFLFVEVAGGALGGRPSRFSRLPLDDRRALIVGWYARVGSPVAQIAEALKGSLGMVYLSHPDVVLHMQTVKTCERPGDPFVVSIDLDAFQGRHAPPMEVAR